MAVRARPSAAAAQILGTEIASSLFLFLRLSTMPRHKVRSEPQNDAANFRSHHRNCIIQRWRDFCCLWEHLGKGYLVAKGYQVRFLVVAASFYVDAKAEFRGNSALRVNVFQLQRDRAGAMRRLQVLGEGHLCSAGSGEPPSLRCGQRRLPKWDSSTPCLWRSL